jgi:hypothetical protein
VFVVVAVFFIFVEVFFFYFEGVSALVERERQDVG